MGSIARHVRRTPILAVIVAVGVFGGGLAPTAGAQVSGPPSTTELAAAGADSLAPVNPTRVMDTRLGLGGGRLSAGETRVLDLGTPEAGAVAASLNVTVVNASAPGYLSVWQAGTARPATSSLNFAAAEERANAVVAAVDGTGQVAIFNATGTADVVVDVTGWLTAGFTTVPPARLLDTRSTVPLADGATRTVPVAGSGGVPASGATAVVATVTVTNPTARGYLTAWPDGSSPPATSSVNFGPGETIAATVLVGLGSTGGVSLVVSGATTDVLVDVVGWFSSGYDALVQPARLLDTRDGTGRCGLFLGPDETRTITVAGAGGVPATGVGAAALNVTVTDVTGSGGVLVVWPTGSPRPLASSLNYRPGQTVANTVLVGVGAAGQVSIANLGGTTEVLVDVNGSFPGTTPAGPATPCPALTTPVESPVAGRFLPDGTITTAAFNLTVAGLGATAVTTSPVRLALGLTDTARSVSSRIQVTVAPGPPVLATVVIDTDRPFDDSVAGVHHEVQLSLQNDGSYRVVRATWGYNCLRRATPPFSPELCP